MRTAIITGASSGMGRELVRQAVRQFPDIRCFWLIARRGGRLRELAAELEGRECLCMSLDLCDEGSFQVLAEKLRDDEPEIELLVNNAGCGYLGSVGEGPLQRQTRMTKLNVTATTAVTALCQPYLVRGGRVVNISSVASFCPNPRMATYSASKAYVSAFSRALGEELRRQGVSVTAVCPGPMDTEFLDVGRIKGRSAAFRLLPYCDPERTARRALECARKGKAVYTPRLFYKFYRLAAKVTPQALMVKFTGT